MRGLSSALRIAIGYYGELEVTGDLGPRWKYWYVSMMVFLYTVYELLLGISAATNSEPNPVIRSMIVTAQVMIVTSWCTCPVVYLLPMLGINAAQAVAFTQVGSCVPDISSKRRVGLVIYQITYEKSNKEGFLDCCSELMNSESSYQYAAEPHFLCVRLVSVYSIHKIL